MARYLADPNAIRRELITVAREGGPQPPVPLLLLSGDAYIRGKRLHAARLAFTAALARDGGAEWTGWASLGLGWIATAQGEFDAARPHYERVAAGAWNPEVGVVGLGLLDAAAGHVDAAVPRLRAVASSPQSHRLREVALLTTAYGYYWSDDYPEAASAFAAAAAAEAGGPLWDDATYGAALSQLRGGDRDGAIAALGSLAGMDDGGTRRERIPPGLRALRVRPVLRASIRRYRSIRFGEPAEQLVGLLDGDGRALARAALASLGEAVTPEANPAVEEESLGGARGRGGAGAPETARPAPSPPASRRDDDGGRQKTHFPWLSLAAALALLVLTGWALASRRRS